MLPCVVTLRNSFIVSLLVKLPFFLQCSAQTHQLLSIAISCDGFGLFEQLTINYTQLIPLNAEQKIRNMDIRLYCWCWCMAGLTARHATLRFIVAYPVFINGHDMIQKKSFLFSRLSCCSHMTRHRSMSLSFIP